MESRHARAKFIRNWIDQAKSDGAAPASLSACRYANYRPVSSTATVRELAEQFVDVLRSFNDQQIGAQDWRVEIAVPDRNTTLYITSAAHELSLELAPSPGRAGMTKPDARLAMPFEDLRLLTNFEIDFAGIMGRNPRIDDPDKPLIRPLSDLLFGAYNLHHLDPAFRATPIEAIYRAGKVSSRSGTQRFIYPWAISADIGNALYRLILSNDIERTLEIGLAYGLSALFMCQAHQAKGSGLHTAIDPCQTVEFESIGIEQVERAGLIERFTLLEEKDFSILPTLVREEEKFGLVFIDGLHMHDYVVLDYFYSDLLLETGGFLVFDDCHAPGVSSAVAYLEENRNYRFIESNSDQRLRVYQKIADDQRSIRNSNHHVDYVGKYRELATSAAALQTSSKPQADAGHLDVAIIGIDGVLPGKGSIEEFWQAIANEERLYQACSAEHLYDRQGSDPGSATLVGGLIRAPFDFDPAFFKLSTGEAEAMDPQLRQLLMSVHRSIEDAGYTAKQMSRSRVGVFIGSEGSEYNELHRAKAFQDAYFLNHAGSAIANKISHHFDFRGPSEVINTMCSSGAFCVYRATELLRQGAIDFAIIGAAKLNFSDEVFRSLNDLNITSPKDRCYSFHERSEGYLRSEGVVTMVLTSARRASADRDCVYARIKGIAVNYNGKDGHSMFSPSKNGQKEVIKECYRRARVPMSAVDFIEAQGMGNAISDFVEFNAINEAYEELLEEQGVEAGEGPAISTLKPIVGHMECVSALGALLKIILSFRSGTIFRVPFLARHEINDKLEVDGKRCKLLTKHRTFAAGRPMLAGLNSFGASGTNVHMVLEAPSADEASHGEAFQTRAEQMLPVSAASVASLHEYVAAIASFLRAGHGTVDVADLCHAFQVRREQYSHRVMFHIEAGDAEAQAAQLLRLLDQYRAGERSSTAILDNISGSEFSFETVVAGAAATESVLHEDGLCWLAGKKVDWTLHHNAQIALKPSRLPSYRFDLKPYKIALTDRASGMSSIRQRDLHPLIQSNTSDLAGLRYRSIFTGHESFLADHQVRGDRIFPAVAYLEMARAAVSDAAGASLHEFCLELRDVVWLQPLIVREDTTVNIVLFPDETQAQGPSEIRYQICSGATDDELDEERVHSQGTALLIERSEPVVLDLCGLAAQMSTDEVAPTDLYRAFDAMGVQYGVAHRGVTGIRRGDRQLLARVALPQSLSATADGYVMHPSLMDSALQTSLALLGDFERLPGGPSLPFALESLKLLAPCANELYVWMRLAPGCELTDSVIKADVDLCDSSGNVCIQMRGFSSRALDTDAITAAGAGHATAGAPEIVSGNVPGNVPGNVAENVIRFEPLRDKAVGYFQRLLSETLKADARSLKPHVPFSDFGLDSVRVVQLTNQLRQTFPGLTTTLFFEVRNIDGLVDHFLAHRKQELVEVLSIPVSVYSGAAAPKRTLRLVESKSRRFPTARPVARELPSFNVAIVGLSGRYPKARDLDQFWANLRNGVNCISEVPADRWEWQAYYSPERGAAGKIYSRWGGFIDGVDEFDPLFFRISPLEAERMDPQERLFLMACYHAIEDAGHTPASLCASRKVGVFVGVTSSPYGSAPDHFSFANRVSYLFDFQGPSLAVDTACSSSLTALHLALESIRNGSSVCAIAGGVNLILKPAHYQRLAEVNALSSGDKCRAFGAQADGFVDAEGVGAVVLKSLEQAERDGDHIYGVIRGSCLNAGGKTNGYTVPNPAAQSALVSDALKSAGLVAEDISYVEAHGTGTTLGDPIEIAGLSRAFGEGTDRKQFCALGSLKSNIGHCEAAAGIAGLTKVLLQFEHGKLVPSLHCEVANPQIDFSATPFKVQTELSEWARPRRGEGATSEEVPRIAGISSFGIGGANAHLIVQEYRSPGHLAVATDPCESVVPLSARTGEQLRAKATALLEFLIARPEVDLRSLGYTLQVGREPMEERVGFVVRSAEDLTEKLRAYVDGDASENVVQGSARGNQSGIELIAHNEDVKRTLISQWLESNELARLLELWVVGLEIDWNLLYADPKPRRMSLPAYPFARDRYWLETSSVTAEPGSRAGALHPLVHRNVSDLSAQRYCTVLTGDERFLTDHQIEGRKIVPAVVYLEMARAAVMHASPESVELSTIAIRNVVWGRPAVVSEKKELTITLCADDEGRIDFEISSEEGEEVVHCQGQALVGNAAALGAVNVDQVRGEMTLGSLEPSILYATFAKMGAQLGESHRGLIAIDRGERQVLARLCLPAVVDGERDSYVLHPSLLDSALHASAALAGEGELSEREPLLPFALDTISIGGPCQREMLVWVRHASGSQGSLIKLDIDLCDREGNVCVQMRGLSARSLRAETASQPEQHMGCKPVVAAPDTFAQIGTLLAVPAWTVSPIEPTQERGAAEFPKRHVVLCELPHIDANELKSKVGGSGQCLSLSLPDPSIVERYNQYALSCFELVRELLKSRSRERTLIQLVVADSPEQSLVAGLSGLLKTAALENPNLAGQVILTDPAITTAALARQLQENCTRTQDGLVRYTSGRRHVLSWREVTDRAGPPRFAFKEHGVYLITGGLGGLGAIFAKEILARTAAAKVILTGRSEHTSGKQARIAGLLAIGERHDRTNDSGPAASQAAAATDRLVYRTLDPSLPGDVERLIHEIAAEYGKLDGILHCAGMTSDSFIIKKTAEEFAQVLAPKVAGTFNLDQATLHLDLDFFALFSSGASVLGSVGQADYATANGFMDRFAAMRNEQVAAGQRQGLTIAINWPYWDEGGMRIDADARDSLERALGVQPMATATGLQAFHRSLSLLHGQALVMEGDLSRMRRALNAEHRDRSVAATATPPDQFVDKLEQYLRQQFSKVLKLPPREIDARAPLEKYGIDSILAMKLTHQLEIDFGSLPKTLLFEYQTLRALAGHFASAHPDVVRQLLNAEPGSSRTNALHVVPERHASLARRKRRSVGPSAEIVDDVAIIGLAGRYPLAEDLDAFWNNLKDGRDCISEIPPDRWDHARYFDPERDKAGKSYSKWGGFIQDVDKFDALFFNISPREAELIDPQERLFLETAWHAIEDAGYSRASVAGGRIGVYVGAMWGHYELLGASAANGAAGISGGVPGSSHASIANRVSYFFDFHGPSIAIDTMCSSSLTAIHLACEELRRGEIDAAIAGGVNVSIHPNKYLHLSQGNFASSDGRCRSFGQGGDGYVPGEGVGAVLLKPLRQAIRDGDRIHAVIKSSVVNHGGKTNGYTVPNPNAQADLIHRALEKARIDPHTLGYVESHGTGTSLGDPIEIAGLAKAFELGRRDPQPDRKQFCAIGSVKSNIGHLESAAGIAAVTKSILQMKHGQLVPSLHADQPNPHISFADSPFFVQTQLADWPRPDSHPRRIAVSSFGAGGTNAHLILEEFVPARVSVADSQPQVFVVSARDNAELRRYVEQMIRFIAQGTVGSFADLAYTSQVGRTPMNERLAVVASSAEELGQRLDHWLSSQKADSEAVFRGSGGRNNADVAALIEGQAGKVFLATVLSEGDLAKVAQLWVSGVDIDWRVLHRGVDRRRVSLPLYPFSRERYWIDAPAVSAPIVQMRDVGVAEKPRTLCYRPEWVATPISSVPANTASGSLLVLNGSDDLFAALREQAQPFAAVFVQFGESYQELANDRFCIDPMREEHVSRLMQALEVRNCLPSRIVHRCQLAEGDEAIDGDIRRLCPDLLAVFHICRGLRKDATVRFLSVVANGPSRGSPRTAALVGFYNTLRLERPSQLGKTLELHGESVDELDIAEQASRILDELADEEWGSTELRYEYVASNGGLAWNRYAKVLTQFTPASVSNAELPLKERGVYLITGGLGGLGFIVSSHLARTFKGRLVLCGRSEPGRREQAKLDQLKSYGSDILYVRADVTKLPDVESLVAAAKAQFGRLDGVIHCAGVHEDALIENKQAEQVERVLAPKICGALNLDFATRGEQLDIFVMFSSAAGCLGNPGQCDYAYANRFLDAFAEARDRSRAAHERHGKTLSIAWPLWAEGGMKPSKAALTAIERETGLAPLPTTDGIACFESILCSASSQCVALYGDAARIDRYLTRATRGVATAPAVERETGASILEATRKYLQRLIGEQIKLVPERVDSNARFESFGMDSMMVSRINSRLQRDLGELPNTLLYEYETVDEVAEYLLQEAMGQLTRLLQVPAAHPLVSTPQPAAIASPERQSAAAAPDEEDSIAIIGIHGYYPGSPTLDAYWENIRDGRNVIGEVPEQRWNHREFYDPDPSKAVDGKIYCKWGGFLDGVDQFDAGLFNISPREAASIDPQERLFLQSVWAALEDSGYSRERLKKECPKGRSADVGVFVGVTTNSYQLAAADEWQRGNKVTAAAVPWSIANRVSYFFDFQGPSMPVDTACSSSLVAVHLACESLRRKDCQLAIAGGVNLYLHPSKYQSFCERRMVSLDGKCRSFGAGDDGFVPGEGVGTLVLKPLRKAVEDGDHIHGVVLASAFEHSGRSNGYSAPNPNSQADLIAHALARGGIHPESIGYIEGHGTGTQLGDSLEIAALTKAFQQQTGKKQFCSVGSVKANMGHSESAAGIAGITKVLLQLQHRQLAPALYSDQPNENIDFENSPFHLQRELAPWNPPAGAARRALINSFGAGGVNACLVLEEHNVPSEADVHGTDAHLFVLSARTPDGLREYATRLRDHLSNAEPIDLARLTYTLQVGRESMMERVAIVCDDTADLQQALDQWLQGTASTRVHLGTVSRPGGRAEVAVGQHLEEIARRWCAGQWIDWKQLHRGKPPLTVSLPTYPFERERHWLATGSKRQEKTVARAQEVRLHPLITRNSSTLQTVRLDSVLTPDEFYSRDHKVNGESIFPGAGFLEIACIAGHVTSERKVATINDIVWAQPLSFRSGPRLVQTALRVIGDSIEYDITSSDEGNERLVHSEGRMRLRQQAAAAAACDRRISIEELRQQHPERKDAVHYYDLFRKLGLDYGPSFQTLQECYTSSASALSRLQVATELKAQFNQYVLHPCVIDAAFQTIAGVLEGMEPGVPHLPFALDEVEIIRPIPQRCWAYARRSEVQDQQRSGLKKFDIQLLNERGDALVMLTGLYLRPIVKAGFVQRDSHGDRVLQSS